MEGVPANITGDLALLLALGADGQRAGAAWTAVHSLLSPAPDAAAFDAAMDRLLARRYVIAQDTVLQVGPTGALFLGSLVELAAARGQAARQMFPRLTGAGWALLAARAAALPARYCQRRGDYAVYVVLLDHAAGRTGRALEANPGRLAERPFLYVGMTSRHPLARYRSHLRGRKSSRYVRRFGICLLPELFDHLNPLDRSGAAALEIDLAADLRARGYGVLGVYPQPAGHPGSP